MAGRKPPPRRTSEYAWLITGPLAAIAIVAFIVFWVADPHWYEAWPQWLLLSGPS